MKSRLDGSLQEAGYGASELGKCYQKYMSRSLVLSIVLQSAFVASLYLLRSPDVAHTPGPVAGILGPIRILIPPPLTPNPNSPASTSGEGRTAMPKGAIPIPSADPLIDTNSTIPSQKQLGESSGIYGDVSIFGGVPEGAVGNTTNDEEPPPFRPVEKLPAIVTSVAPVYPQNAIRAGIEGTVLLNIWVDRMGKVRKAVVLRSDSEVLNSAAIEAAMAWVFTPAIMQHGPVSVWVHVPFNFRLNKN